MENGLEREEQTAGRHFRTLLQMPRREVMVAWITVAMGRRNGQM